MRRVATLIAAALIASAGMMTISGHAEEAAGRDGAFIHISHGADDPHRFLMGLKMAVTMAEGEKDVLVYCDIEAVKLLARQAKDVSHKAFPPSSELLDRLQTLKVPVLACPTCLKAADIKTEDLRPGVEVAQKDRFFSFTEGRILTLDY